MTLVKISAVKAVGRVFAVGFSQLYIPLQLNSLTIIQLLFLRWNKGDLCCLSVRKAESPQANTPLTHCYCLYKHIQNSFICKNSLTVEKAVLVGCWKCRNIHRTINNKIKVNVKIHTTYNTTSTNIKEKHAHKMKVTLFKDNCQSLNLTQLACQNNWVQTWMHLLVMLTCPDDTPSHRQWTTVLFIGLFKQ